MGTLGVFLLLSGALGTLAEICVIPQIDGQLVEKLGQRLLPWMDLLSLEHLNPSIYVGLRLSSLQAGAKENYYLHSLKHDYQQCLLGSASGQYNSSCENKQAMDHLALYLLALRANCEFIGGHDGDRLVSQLKQLLEEENTAIGPDHKGYPRTDYYKYGLSILALCVHQKQVHDQVVDQLLHAVEHDPHLHQGPLSVETVAMAGLAFTCLERSNFNPNHTERISKAIKTVKEKILKAQTPDGFLGKFYATPLSLQLLMTSPMPGVDLGTACLKARSALLAIMPNETIQDPHVISQLLPILNNKTYIDLMFPDCKSPRVMLMSASDASSPSHNPEIIEVKVRIVTVMPLYEQPISVPAGSSVEDVLKKSLKLGFMNNTQVAFSGFHLTFVNYKAIEAELYKHLLQAWQKAMEEYRPQDGDDIELWLDN